MLTETPVVSVVRLGAIAVVGGERSVNGRGAHTRSVMVSFRMRARKMPVATRLVCARGAHVMQPLLWVAASSIYCCSFISTISWSWSDTCQKG